MTLVVTVSMTSFSVAGGGGEWVLWKESGGGGIEVWWECTDAGGGGASRARVSEKR